MKTLRHCFPPNCPARRARGVFNDPMNSVTITTRLDTGICFGCCCSSYSHICTSRAGSIYFRAWQLAWAAYSLHYISRLPFRTSSVAFFISELFLVAMALCIFVSTRMMRGLAQPRWYDAALGGTGVVLALLDVRGHIVNGVFRPNVQPAIRLGSD